MAQRPPRRRRSRQPPPAVLAWPLWKRAAGAAFFILGGGGAAVWGFYDAASWIGSLHRGAGVIETENFILGFPLMGVALCALGPEFIVPRLLANWSDTVKTRVAGVVLGAMLAGIALVLVGQIVINVAMEAQGYRACEVQGRGRYTSVTWARADVACHKADAVP